MGDFNLLHVLVLIFLSTTLVHSASCATLTNNSDIDGHVIGCIDAERRALLDLKQGFTHDPSGRLSSWQGEDCCKWIGVRCSNKTGHVLKLNLSNPVAPPLVNRTLMKRSSIGGEIRPSLIHLKHLRHLDLSYNDFKGNAIPKFIGALEHLRYLDLSSYSCFSGEIPPLLGNLSNLVYLNLNSEYCFIGDNIIYPTSLKADSLHWLSGLTSLRYLNMGYVNLTLADEYGTWLDHVNMLPALQELHLSDCGLHTLPPSLSFLNFTSLQLLDLSFNSFNASLPHWLVGLHYLSTLHLYNSGLQGHIPDALGGMTSLQYLHLSDNHLTGKMPTSFGNYCNLRMLDLSSNNISGEITELLDGLSLCPNKSLEMLCLTQNQVTGVLPNSLGSFKNLKYLIIHDNNISGSIPENIGKLSELVILSLSSNFFEGFLSESHFTNLTKLEQLVLCSHAPGKSCVILNVTSNWIPPFTNLRIAHVPNSPLGPSAPFWLQSQKNLMSLYLRNTSISGTLDWVWKLPSLIELDLSFNKIKGGIHIELNDNISIQNSTHPLFGPPSSSNLRYLQLKGNMLSGFIPPNVGRLMPYMRMLDLSMNNIKGIIPSSICELSELETLIFSNNTLTGDIPQRCWKDFRFLKYVDLSYNHLTGKVPSSLIGLSSLLILKLSNNRLYGELSSTTSKHNALISLDLGENSLSGKLPSWKGNCFPYLRILRLHSNHFIGEIPSQICSISSLQVLDLGGNELSGTMPHCFGNFSVMAKGNNEYDLKNIGINIKSQIIYNDTYFLDLSMVVYKGMELEFTASLRFLRGIDLSNNNLSGDLPQELTELVGLSILNLSRNHFEGMIPKKIGKLEMLESLDLSHNQLSGPIPHSIASLSSLSHLNLSYNNLKGRIPSSTQLQTLFDSSPSIYEGNPQLCGPPLVNKCEWHETTEGPSSTSGKINEDDEAQMPPFYIGMLFGSIVGFWGVWGALILRKSWRHSYFRFVDGIIDWIYVFIAIKIKHMQGRM